MSIAISAGALWLALRKAPHEQDSIDADTVEKFERVAKSAAERAEKTDARVAQMQTRYDELFAAYEVSKAEIRMLREEINEVKEENGRLKQWAELLVQQVVSLGGKPVPMPERKSRPRE